MTKKQKKPGSKPKWILFLNRHTGLKYFLLAFGCCLVLFGIIVGAMVISMTPSSPTQTAVSSQPPVSSTAASAASSALPASSPDDFTLMLVTIDDSNPVAVAPVSGTSSGAVSNVGKPATIAVVRFDAVRSRFAILQVPLEQVVSSNGANITVANDYKANGITTMAADFTKKTMIKINYTCVVSFSKISSIMNTLGGLQYNVPADMSYTSNDLTVHTVPHGTQLLMGDSILAMLGTPSYGSTAVDKYNMQADLLEAFLKAKLSGDYLANAQTTYGSVLSLVQTNLKLSNITSRLKSLQRVTSQSGDYIQQVKPQYIPIVQGSGSVFDYDSNTSSLFYDYFDAK